eukprot:jgi/Ulvmu1/11912/UM081_0072.1
MCRPLGCGAWPADDYFVIHLGSSAPDEALGDIWALAERASQAHDEATQQQGELTQQMDPDALIAADFEPQEMAQQGVHREPGELANLCSTATGLDTQLPELDTARWCAVAAQHGLRWDTRQCAEHATQQLLVWLCSKVE